MKILFVLAGTEFDGATAQLGLLAAGLPSDRFTVRVCSLGTAGAGTVVAGVPVEPLGWARLLDPRPLFQLRRLVREFAPDIIHAGRMTSLRALALAVGRPAARLVASHPFTARARRHGLSRLDRWLLRRADCVVASGPAEADRCVREGVASGKVVV